MTRFKLDVAEAWRRFRDPYRPELHYMRGPGPRTLGRNAGRKPVDTTTRETGASKRPSDDDRLAT